MHYQELSALYSKWSMTFREYEDKASASWAQKLAADYANTARGYLIRLIDGEI